MNRQQHLRSQRTRPYTLDTTVSMDVDGVTLYPLIATKDIHIPNPMYQAVATKGTRGGWVPSLDVLEAQEGYAPWLDSNSMVTHPLARLRGPVLLENSAWKSTGILQASSQSAWTFVKSTFTGNTTLQLSIPPNVMMGHPMPTMRSIQVHASAIKGFVSINDSCIAHTDIHAILHCVLQSSSLRHCQIESTEADAYVSIQRSQMEHAHIMLQEGNHRFKLEDSHWAHVQYQDLRAITGYTIHRSHLAYMRCTHDALSNSICAHDGPQLVEIPPIAAAYSPHDAFFVPIHHNQAPTHFVWFLGRDYTEQHPPTLTEIYEVRTQRAVRVENLDAYIDELRTQDDSFAHTSASILQWLQWQQWLGALPSVDTKWIYAPVPDITQDLSQDPPFLGVEP